MQKLTSPEDALEAIKYLASMIYAEAQQASDQPANPKNVVAYDFSKVNWERLQDQFRDALTQGGWRTEADALADLYIEVRLEPTGSSEQRTYKRLSEKPELLPENGSGVVVQWTGGKLHLLMAFPSPALCAGLRYSPHVGELELYGRSVPTPSATQRDPAASGSPSSTSDVPPKGFKSLVKDMIMANPLFTSNPSVVTKNPHANVKTVYCEIRPVTTVTSSSAPSAVGSAGAVPARLSDSKMEGDRPPTNPIRDTAVVEERPPKITLDAEKKSTPPPQPREAKEPNPTQEKPLPFNATSSGTPQKVPTPKPYVCDPTELNAADLLNLLQELNGLAETSASRETQLKSDREKLEVQFNRRAELDRKAQAVHKQELRHAAVCAEADDWEQRREAIEARSDRVKSSG